ncbi:MAG: hypothetical protein M3Y73_10855, partial [Actinomycetota bacterium]|nr:hypothetical protein [Actinomycetota bacterium]
VHPGWCDPRYCRFTDIDIQHRSTPTLLSTCEHKWWFTLARADEWVSASPARRQSRGSPAGRDTRAKW